MLRLAVDATPLLAPRTGIGNATAAVIGALVAREEVTVVPYALTWRGRHRLAAALPPRTEPTSRPLAARPLRAAWKRWDLPPIEWWTGPVDVVFGPNFVVPPTRRAAAVVTVNDLTPVHYPELCTRDTLAYPRLIERALDRGAWVHAISEFVAEEVREHFPAARHRTVAIPLGVDRVGPGDGAAGRRHAGADRYVLALGTVEPRKDLPGLVEAYDRIASGRGDTRLVIAGPDGWGAEALDHAIDGARNRSSIVRLGWVDDATRTDLLRGATVLAYPSIYEGFGLPPLEAMSAEVPVVATAAGAVAETVGDAALLVPPRDTESLAGALRRVLDEPELAADLVRRGTDRVGRYSWDRCADGLVDLFHRAAAEHS